MLTYVIWRYTISQLLIICPVFYPPLSSLLSRFFIQEWLLPLTKYSFCNHHLVYVYEKYIVIAILFSSTPEECFQKKRTKISNPNAKIFMLKSDKNEVCRDVPFQLLCVFLIIGTCYSLSVCVPQNLYVEILIPQCNSTRKWGLCMMSRFLA